MLVEKWMSGQATRKVLIIWGHQSCTRGGGKVKRESSLSLKIRARGLGIGCGCLKLHAKEIMVTFSFLSLARAGVVFMTFSKINHPLTSHLQPLPHLTDSPGTRSSRAMVTGVKSFLTFP